jgi:hypothetical protein
VAGLCVDDESGTIRRGTGLNASGTLYAQVTLADIQFDSVQRMNELIEK